MLLIIHPFVFRRQEIPKLLTDLNLIISINGFQKRSLCPTSLKVIGIEMDTLRESLFFIKNDQVITSEIADKLNHLRSRYSQTPLPKGDFVFRVITDQKEEQLLSAVLKI